MLSSVFLILRKKKHNQATLTPPKIHIRTQQQVNDGSMSMCKVDVAVLNPELITHATGDKLPPVPPVVTMLPSIKTVASPRRLLAMVQREVSSTMAWTRHGSRFRMM